MEQQFAAGVPCAIHSCQNRQLPYLPAVGAVHIHALYYRTVVSVGGGVKMPVPVSQCIVSVCIAVLAAMSAVGLIAQGVEGPAARLGEADDLIPAQVILPLLRLHKKAAHVLIPVCSRLNFKVCGGGGSGFGGAGGEGEGQGEGEKQRGEKASFHQKNSFLRRAISDKPIIADGFIRCQL